MNVQGASVLSLLSGAEGVGNIQPGLLGGSPDQAGFASALMEQLGLLQGTDSPDLASLQSFMDGASVEGGMQNFAAFFGKNLPTAGKLNQDIDLDETLQTLADVMQQLQQLDTSALPQESIPADVDEALKALSSETDVDETALANSAVAMPIAVPTDLNELAKQTEDSLELSGLLIDGDKPESLLIKDTKVQNTAVEVAAKPDELGVEFDRSISAMLGNEQAGGKPQQDKPALDLKSETALAEINSVSNDSDIKTSAGIAGDIARMSAAVRNEAASTSVPTSQPSMQKHISDPGWHQELGEKLIWMNKQATPSVELRLNPEHLGPVLVKIDVSQDQASVAFTTQHQAVKEVIEAAIPKLKEMLQGQQLNLADVNVSQQQSEQRQSPRDFFQMASDQGRQNNNGSEASETGTVNEAQSIVDEIEAGRAIASNGLLSLFA